MRWRDRELGSMPGKAGAALRFTARNETGQPRRAMLREIQPHASIELYVQPVGGGRRRSLRRRQGTNLKIQCRTCPDPIPGAAIPSGCTYCILCRWTPQAAKSSWNEFPDRAMVRFSPG